MASAWIEPFSTGSEKRRYRVRYRLGGAETNPQYGGKFSTKQEAKARCQWIEGELAAMRVPDLKRLVTEHRATILDPRWRDVGIAAVEAAGAPGMYSGLNVVVVTADFGTH